jgi:hypothetical protein
METNMIIKLGDKHQVQAKKKGFVRLGEVDIEVFFVPEFRISLLSVGQLDLSGYTATFRSGICSITNTKGRKVLSAILEQGLYILSTDGSAHISEIRSLRNVQHPNMVNLWHQRFAHINYQDLRRILDAVKKRTTAVDPMDECITDPSTDNPTEEPVIDSPDTRNRTTWKTPDLCQTCVHTKQQQHVIRTKASRTSTPFELIHSDLCGPIKHSTGGAQYYIIYIDDCTRYTEVYFLTTKMAEEISAKFRHYLAVKILFSSSVGSTGNVVFLPGACVPGLYGCVGLYRC